MARNLKKDAKKSIQLNYLNKDFNSFRRDLTNYATTHFSGQIRDFSENSVGGMFVELAAYVGDVMSYYLDHQFNELNLETAVEEENVERLIRNSGIVITGASPATVTITIYMRVDAVYDSKTATYIPNKNQLPIIQAGTKVASFDGTIFEITRDYDFAEKDNLGNFIFSETPTVGNTTGDGTPIDMIIAKECIFTSAITKTQSFTIPNSFKPFRTIRLAEADISEIISVLDTDQNEYHEVKSLAHDIVFKSFLNMTSDRGEVPESLEILPAPRRFVPNFSLIDGITTLRFGSGRSDTYEDDIVPDPSDHALPLYGNKRSFSRFSIDPNILLESRTLGVSPVNTQLTVTYRHGGGFSHNVGPGQITEIIALVTKFNSAVTASKSLAIKRTIEVYNELSAAGGTDRPTLDDMRGVALNYQGSQDRVVTKQDLLTRVYTMPSKFGRVYRISVSKNNFSQNTALLRVITKDSNGFLTIPNDSLKQNIAKYINQYRLIGDSIDIIDGQIINYAVRFTITVKNTYVESNVLTSVLNKLKTFLKTENYQIDQPINMSDLSLLITSTDGVNTLTNLNIDARTGTFQERNYSVVSWSVTDNIRKGILHPPVGGIFELKFPDDDIKGRVI
jgi:hypothetical protein